MSEMIQIIEIGQLEGHPAALAFWPDSAGRRADVAAICASVRELGRIREPLEVCAKARGGWWVIDGCTRLEGARQAGLERVPCRVVEMAEEAIPDEVYLSNMTRTRFGTGMRVMRYLEKHKKEVLETAVRNACLERRGAQGGRGHIADVADTRFTAKVIAERLRVSNKDVLSGIELLRCMADNKRVNAAAPGIRVYEPLDDGEREALERTYSEVLAGDTPLRRWVAGMSGRIATEGKVKAPDDYAAIAKRCSTGLRTAFQNWHLAKWHSSGERDQVEAIIADMLRYLPDCGRAAVLEQISSWPEKDSLRKALAKK